MNLLITGVTGFIGTNFLEYFSTKDFDITIILRDKRSHLKTKKLPSRIKIIFVEDIINDRYESLHFDTIVHLATHYIKEHTFNDIGEIIRSNIEFPAQVIEFAMKRGANRLINLGTFFEFDLSQEITSKSPFYPYNFYAASKKAFETLLESYPDMQIINLKIFTPYGKYDCDEKIIPKMVRSSLKNETFIIQNGNQYLSPVYALDIIKAIEKALFFQAPNKRFSTLIKSEPVPIKDIYETLSLITDTSSLEIEFKEVVKLNIKEDQNFMNFQWTPQISLQEGLSQVVSYYKGLR